MAIIKQLDKRSGITYVYESTSYWDKEKQQPRSKRKLIGRLDPDTGEIVPTDGRGKRRSQPETESPVKEDLFLLYRRNASSMAPHIYSTRSAQRLVWLQILRPVSRQLTSRSSPLRTA